ncbi:N/A [soil metagenome]
MIRPTGPGFAVLLTGFSGAGKSTVAEELLRRWTSQREVTVLDGDIVRTMLSHGLTFSREDRDLNIRRIGWVSAEVVRHGGAVIIAAIAPYDGAREEARQMVEAYGVFGLVHLSTPLEICEGRDVKGLYAKARAGEIGSFTGISDPYELPAHPDVVVDTSQLPVEASADAIEAYLRFRGIELST